MESGILENSMVQDFILFQTKKIKANSSLKKVNGVKERDKNGKKI
jgi:hypothetical protein